MGSRQIHKAPARGESFSHGLRHGLLSVALRAGVASLRTTTLRYPRFPSEFGVSSLSSRAPSTLTRVPSRRAVREKCSIRLSIVNGKARTDLDRFRRAPMKQAGFEVEGVGEAVCGVDAHDQGSVAQMRQLEPRSCGEAGFADSPFPLYKRILMFRLSHRESSWLQCGQVLQTQVPFWYSIGLMVPREH